MYYIYGVSVPSLLIESTDSMIYRYYHLSPLQDLEGRENLHVSV